MGTIDYTLMAVAFPLAAFVWIAAIVQFARGKLFKKTIWQR